MVEISTSLLMVEKEDIIKTIYNLETAHTDYFHIDVMDGEFVENDTNTRMQEYCEYLNQISSIPLDVHLMVNDVENYIKSYMIFNPNIITFHHESVGDLESEKVIINNIKENGCKVGVAIKPNTDIEEIYEILPFIHVILIMTVEPGKGGQELIPGTLEKVKRLKEYVLKNNFDVDIEVDGGIKLENAELLKDAGATILVAGSGIIGTEDYGNTIKKMRE